MFVPFAIDIASAAGLYFTGHLQWLGLQILALSAIIHINHAYSVQFAERQARLFAIPEDEQPVASVVFSMKPRRLRDYSNRNLEVVFALSSIVVLAWLIRYYFASPEHHNLRLVFGVPAFYFYLHIGTLFVKRVIVAWRAPVPQAQAAEYMEAREQTRKYYLKVCDWFRASVSSGILFWPFVLSSPPARFTRISGIFFSATLLASVIGGIWIEIKRRQLIALSLRARPVKLPDFLNESELARWPMCYQPSVPMLILKGARGYSLNLANTLTHLGAAYLAGMAVLVGLLVMRH
jgi:hypothetical protein